MRLSEIKTEGALKVLIFGNSGSGKTCLAAAFPGPILFLDFDSKVDSAAMFYRNNPELLNGVDVRQLSGTFTVSPIQQLERIIADELIPQEKTGAMQFKTLVLDSLTTFSAQVLKHIVDSNPGIKRVITKQGQQPGLQDYGILKREFAKLIPNLLALPCNVVMLGHIETSKDEVTGEIIRGPMLDGGFAQQLPIYFKEVWRSYVDEKGQFMLQTKSDARYSLRSQIHGLPNPIKNSYAEVEKYIKQ